VPVLWRGVWPVWVMFFRYLLKNLSWDVARHPFLCYCWVNVRGGCLPSACPANNHLHQTPRARLCDVRSLAWGSRFDSLARSALVKWNVRLFFVKQHF